MDQTHQNAFLSLIPASISGREILLKNLETEGFLNATEIQMKTLPLFATQKNLLAISQTGTGKTLAYLVPMLMNLSQQTGARGLILTPSRETADQIYSVLEKLVTGLSISTCLASTALTVKETAKALRKNPKIIVATPGRLLEHLAENKLLLQGLKFMVIDEADRMWDLGFESQILNIQATLRGERQTWMFAASMNRRIDQKILTEDFLEIRAESTGAPVEKLQQIVLFLAKSQKEFRLLDELKTHQDGVIIFTADQEGCAKLGRLLEHKGFSSDFVHGEMNPGHRNRILREFRQQQLSILVTTDLLARGLDIPHVKTVINYDLPYKAEDFLHRIGRTARAGREGKAITFITPSDLEMHKKIKKYLLNAEEQVLSQIF